MAMFAGTMGKIPPHAAAACKMHTAICLPRLSPRALPRAPLFCKRQLGLAVGGKMPLFKAAPFALLHILARKCSCTYILAFRVRGQQSVSKLSKVYLKLVETRSIGSASSGEKF
jgi:hypothetical protein